MTSTLGMIQPRSVDLLPPTLQTIPEAIGKNIAIARAQTRSRIMAVVKADGYGHGAITVARAAIAAGAEWRGTTDTAEASRLRAAGLTVPILTWLNPSGVDAEAAATDRIDIAAVKAGTPVGYGGTYVTDTSTNLSVLPLGYADGIPREISPDASVEIHGRRHPVVGRVSMDQIVIDTGADYVPLGTTATVFGPQDGVTPTIRDWAGWAGTIPHTIVTGIGPRVNRRIA